MGLSADGWAIIGVVLPVLAAAGYWHFDRFEKRLNNPDDKYARDRAARALTAPSPWKAYLYALRRALDALTDWMGQRAGLKIWTRERGDWAKSFGWCLGLAFVYPVAILLVIWLFGGSATVGTANLLPSPESMPFWRRLLLIVLLIVIAAMCALLPGQTDKILAAISNQRIGQAFPLKHEQTIKLALGFLVSALVIAFTHPVIELRLILAIAIALVVAVTIDALSVSSVIVVAALAVGVAGTAAFVAPGSGAFAIAVAMAGISARTIVKAADKAVTKILPVALSLATAEAIIGFLDESISLGNDQITAWVLFLALLPIINAVFDWLSWQISRGLGDMLLTASEDPTRTLWSRLSVYIFHIAIDFLLALFFLGGLAWTIPRVIEGWNAFVRWMGDEPSLDLATYLCNAAREPLAEGFWAVGMLFSTLLPTVIHLLFLLGALLFGFIAWALSAHATNRARAAHIALGTRPPKADLTGWTEEEIREYRATPVDYGQPGFNEDRPTFQGKLNPETVHQVALQLRVWRPLCYAVVFCGVVYAAWQVTPALVATATAPLPEPLRYVAANFDDQAVSQCFP